MGNTDVVGNSSLSELLVHDFWGQDIRLPDSHKSYRPVTTLSYRLNHRLHGLNSAGFHGTNIALYTVVAMLVYMLALQLISEDGAIVAAILFTVHPVHVEAVTSLVGRADVLSGLFFVLGCLSHLSALEGSRTTMQCFTLVILGSVCATLSAFSKETGVTAFGVLIAIDCISISSAAVVSLNKVMRKLLWDVCHYCSTGIRLMTRLLFMSDEWVTAYLRRNRQQRFVLASYGELLISCVCALTGFIFRTFLNLLLIVSILVLRFFINGNSTNLYQWTVLENQFSLIPDFKTRSLSYAQSHFWYALKLFYPIHMCFDYGYACIPTIDKFFDFRFVQ